ncbi:MFS transporter [Actinomycetospora cinnamomea]|uniref:Putative MFS family arabinose efflux permease n=1 Tax=Actinomycetospora cinnamomea TaxID=663609 RepID=A0A2U1FM84_9PSEU|nr:MFS transporter [Actinomycetospora cinnamomea]PVZ13212.1 putative MFS family arabinose efflux permease [Actinomycetospora cinnamomea]
MSEAGADTATEPARRRGGTFAALRVRNYRLFASGQVVSLVGTWMQRVAQDWLVLELSGGSPVALGIAAALQFGPTLLLSLWGGAIADRYDKRRLLMGLQIGMGACALVLGLLDVTGLVTIAQVYVLCVLLGCFSALDGPVRQSFAGEMVGSGALANAVALNSMTFNTARILGPAVAGLLVAAVGTGWVFLLNAATFVAVLAGLLAMRPAEMYAYARAPRERGAVRAGLREVRRHPDVVLLLVLVFFVSTLGINFFVTLAIVARNVFGRGAESYGLLTSALGVGCLLGALVAARRVGRPRLRTVLVAAVVFGVCEAAAGLMPSYALVALLLVPTGAAQLLFTSAANAAVQLGVDESVRGRVMGLWMVVLLGGTPVGGPALGWLAAELGGRAPLVLGGAASALVALLAGLWVVLRRRREGQPTGQSWTGSLASMPSR